MFFLFNELGSNVPTIRGSVQAQSESNCPFLAEGQDSPGCVKSDDDDDLHSSVSCCSPHVNIFPAHHTELVDIVPAITTGGEETRALPGPLLNPARGYVASTCLGKGKHQDVAPVLHEQGNAIGSQPEDMLRMDVNSSTHSPGIGVHSHQASTSLSNIQSSLDLPSPSLHIRPQLVSDVHCQTVTDGTSLSEKH